MSGRVKPSSRAGRYSVPQDDIDRATSMAERFTGHNPEVIGRVEMPKLPKVVTVIGDLDGVLYTTVRDGKVERYVHEFADSDKPLLAVSPDGRQLIIVGGGYRFTELGIVDDSDEEHADAV